MEGDIKDKAIAWLAAPWIILLAIIAFLPLGIFRAWVVQKLYVWFLIPLNFPALNLWHVFGISLLISQFKSSDSEKDPKFLQNILVNILGNLLALGLGYIVKGHI